MGFRSSSTADDTNLSHLVPDQGSQLLLQPVPELSANTNSTVDTQFIQVQEGPLHPFSVTLQNCSSDTEGPSLVTIDDVPGLRVSLLANQPPQSVFDLDIIHLIGFLEGYQTTCSNQQKLGDILLLLQHYNSYCPNLRLIRLVYPWNGTLPSIDIKIDSKVGLSAEVELSCSLADGLIEYVRAS